MKSASTTRSVSRRIAWWNSEPMIMWFVKQLWSWRHRVFSVAAPRAWNYRRSWNCCDRRTRFVMMWKHFCFILSTGTRIRTDSVMRPRSSSRGRNTSASVTVTVTLNRQRYWLYVSCSWCFADSGDDDSVDYVSIVPESAQNK